MESRHFSIIFMVAMLLCIAQTDAQYHKFIQKERNERGRFKPSIHLPKQEQTTKLNGETREGIEDYRLPTALKPFHQLIRIEPTIGGTWINYGYTEIDFDCLESTNVVEFHMRNIVTINETITLVDMAAPTVNLTFTSHQYNLTKEVYRGILASPLEVGKSYKISMMYEGLVDDSLSGLYRSFYENENGTDVYLATTQFESIDARKAFPCFDEPAFKAKFDIEVLTEPPRNSISNMPVISTFESPDRPGFYWNIFNTTLPMSTYLIAFIISDFEYVQRTTNDNSTLFRIYARSNSIGDTNYALRNGPDILTFFEGYYEIDFPLLKQDMAAIPDFSAGAMENWGLITYREEYLLYDPAENSADVKQFVDVVMAHELAHQWFGDLVTMEWWTDLWLNEGFAAYMEYLGVNAVQEDYDYFNFFCYYNVQYAFLIDSLESSHPIYVEINNPNQIESVFDGITYQKGSSVIRMMRYFVTEDTFRQALNNYLTDNSYGNARQDDLWNAMNEQAMIDGTLDPSLSMKAIMDTWTLQVGYPILDIVIDTTAATASVHQERFLQEANPNATNYQWWIPLTWTTSANPIFDRQGVDMWMNDTTESLVISNLPAASWMLFNVDQAGFYRVNYDEDNWNALSAQLSADHSLISILSRGQLIDDSMNLAKSVPPRVTYPLALDLLKYVKNETDHIPMATALHNLQFIEAMFTATAGYLNLKKFILDLIKPLSTNVGFVDSISDPHLTQLTRASLVDWNCHLDEPNCIQSAQDEYALWMANPILNKISPNIKESVICTAIANGGDEEWNFAWDIYVNSNNAAEKSELRYALGCSRQSYILTRYLDRCFIEAEYMSEFRTQESYAVFYSVAKNDYGNLLAENYLNENWDALYMYYGAYFPLAYLESYIADEYNTQNDLLKLNEFRVLHANDLGASVAILDGTVDQTNRNIAWTDTHYDTIKQWLVDEGFVSTI